MRELLPSVEMTLRQTFGGEPDWRFLVPGRLEVFGKHTDYAGGRSLVAAVPRGFAIAARAAGDGVVDVIDAASGARFSCRIGDREPNISTGWHRYVATVVRRLTTNFPSADLSSRIVLASTLPSAAGISSSSALVIGIAEVLIARGGIEATRPWQEAIHAIEDRVSYFGCIENGAAFGPLTGDEGVGTHGGSEDHAAIVMGRSGALQQCSFAPLRLERRVRMPAGWTFVVLSSGVRASKTGRAREDYNRLAAEAAAIRDIWMAAHPDDPRTLAELARSSSIDGLSLAPRLAGRFAHLRAEDARVPDAADAFDRGDVARLGELAAHSQMDAERLLGNQVRETMDLVSLARERGAAAASSFGAGWGGSVWALVQADRAGPFLEEWAGAYKVKYPHREGTGFVCPPSTGLERL